MTLTLFLIIATFLTSCVVADEDDVVACERRVVELEQEIKKNEKCCLEFNQAIYEARQYKEQAENCVDRKIKGK